ncbi:MAG: hypothetical protein JXM70_07895 [Pirellulales bacterium]|nr:hypothetical protein [Pirellulales bacterium]
MRTSLSTYWNRYRGELAIDWLAEVVQRSIRWGIDAISMFGEVSPLNAGAELNYLALENYGSRNNRIADLDVFLDTVAGQLLGERSSACEYLSFARTVGKQKETESALQKIHTRISSLPEHAARRWIWLANYLFLAQNSPSIT